MNCLNCNATLAGEAKFCDFLCRHGYSQRAYRELEQVNKELMEEVQQLKRRLKHE